jgi:hypothetical protein
MSTAEGRIAEVEAENATLRSDNAGLRAQSLPGSVIPADEGRSHLWIHESEFQVAASGGVVKHYGHETGVRVLPRYDLERSSVVVWSMVDRERRRGDRVNPHLYPHTTLRCAAVWACGPIPFR